HRLAREGLCADGHLRGSGDVLSRDRRPPCDDAALRLHASAGAATSVGGLACREVAVQPHVLAHRPPGTGALKEAFMTLLIEGTHELDVKGLQCPMPIVKTAKAMKELASGEVIRVFATDPGSVKDFAAW